MVGGGDKSGDKSGAAAQQIAAELENGRERTRNKFLSFREPSKYRDLRGTTPKTAGRGRWKQMEPGKESSESWNGNSAKERQFRSDLKSTGLAVLSAHSLFFFLVWK